LKNTWLLRRYHEVSRIGQEINLSLEDTYESLFEKLHQKLADIVDTSYFLSIGHPPTTQGRRF
jgi:hypothetical protein